MIAGPNGSGKSTLYERSIAQESGQSVWIINPDELSAQIQRYEDAASPNLEAVMRIEAWLEASIKAYKSVAVETVLSTDKYRRLVLLSRQYRFRFRLTYVLLDSAQKSVERVRLRIQKGGHSVPEDKIQARYSRSIQQLQWFLEQADSAAVFDNSGEEPVLIAEKKDGQLTVDENALEVIKELARRMQTS